MRKGHKLKFFWRKNEKASQAFREYFSNWEFSKNKNNTISFNICRYDRGHFWFRIRCQRKWK